MSGTATSTPPREMAAAGAETQAAATDVSLLAGILAFAGCALFVAMLPPVSDHAYQFFMAERVLAGARLYIDIGAADMHPPLFTWLAMAVTVLGRVFGTDGLTIYPFLVALLVPAVVLWVRHIRGATGWMLAVFAFALLGIAGPYAGQGEHLAVVLVLPYLAGTASAAHGQPLRRWAAVAAGLAAAIGLAMKPHFALVWLAVELWLATRNGLRSLLRTEAVTIGAVFVIYVLATILIAPTLFALIPTIGRLYPRFAPRPFLDVLVDARVLLLLAALVAAWWTRDTDARGSFARVFALAALAMYATLLLQGKGWGYHWYPITALCTLVLGLALDSRLHSHRLAVPALALAAMVSAYSQVDRTAQLLAQEPGRLPELMEVVERHSDGEPIVALSYLLQTGFPLVNLTGSQWASPYAHLWMVPAIYDDVFAGRAPARYRETGEWRGFEQQMFDRIWERIERDDPALIILQAPFSNGFDMRAYFETDPRFRARLVRSPVLDTVGRYIVLGRPRGGS